MSGLDWPMAVGVLLARVLVGGLLILAGVLKLRLGTQWFFKRVLDFNLIKGSVAFVLAWALPPLEILLGVCLVLGLLLPWAVLAAFVMLLVFTAALLRAFWRGMDVDCGCFGRRMLTTQARWRVVYRNVVLMGLLLFVSVADRSAWTLDQVLPEELSIGNPSIWPAAVAAALWVGAVAGLFFIRHKVDKAM